MNPMLRSTVWLAAAAAVFAGAVSAQVKPADVSALKAPAATTTARPQAMSATGTVQVVVRLTDPPLAAVAGNKRTGMKMTGAQQRAYLATLAQKQTALMTQIRALGGSEITRLAKSHNALVIATDASKLAAIAKLPGVSMIRPVVDYELVLSETVPYIGATAVQQLGFDGTGVRVAVLDSGIDYTHRNLGGPGTLAAYQAAYGTSPSDPKNTTRDGLFPTAKVVGGFDFVGETWPNGPLTPDDDPIDHNGHGTHVADIIAGHSLDDTHKGVAPGASLYAVKVCSAVSTSCSGVALLEGMEFALDPNHDGDISDAVDVVNMSLGSNYGQREDDLSEASAIASRFGIVVVAAAGNAANLPFVASSPANTPEAISVAQTQVPSAKAYPLIINSPASIAGSYPNTATVDFAPIDGGATGDVSYVGQGCKADTYLANPAGKVALVDRGTCAVSEKVRRASDAGALGVLVGLVAAGDAVSFSNGGDCPVPPDGTCKPTLVITRATANLIKANRAAPVNVTFSSSTFVPLVGSIVGSSARGPGYSYVSIKPDIGAPGASVSAVVGTGDGEEAFGGTSGATPMISGSAALVLQAYPSLTPNEVKARLMNAAETNIFTNPATVPGELAPITRLGGGEIRVDRSVMLTTGAWDAADPFSVSLSVGAYRLTGTNVLRKKVTVRNYASMPRTYTITPSFRYADDQASGALTLSAPASVNVPANGTATFTLTMTLNASKLPTWVLNGGSQGGNGALLNLPEYDGYVSIADANDTVHLPWHILPHKSANVRPATMNLAMGGAATKNLLLTNTGGAIAGRVDSFYLLGTSPRLPSSVQPRPGDNFAIIDLKAIGARLVAVGNDLGVQFAVNTFGQRAHPNYPAEFDIYLDSDNDGVPDHIIFNLENGGFGATGQNVVGVVDLTVNPPTTTIKFFADADLVSSNVILTALLSDAGIDPDKPFSFDVLAFDNYFTGALTDFIGPVTVTLDNPRFFGQGVPAAGVPVNGSSNLTVFRFPSGDAASPSQSGLLLMYRDAKNGIEADAVTVTP